MDKSKVFSLIAAFLCAAFIFSCSEEKPVELPTVEKKYAYSFCVFIDKGLCESGNFSSSCRGDGILSNSCPFENIVPTYSYCVFIEEERCEEGIFEFCYGGGALSNNCPYDEIVIIEESSSSSEEASSSSSEEISEPSSSSEEEPSSSSEGRGLRSSSAKTGKNGEEYIDYPTLEKGDPSVRYTTTTRYWDGCKPSCSWILDVRDSYGGKIPNPLVMSRTCDRNGDEMPLFYVDQEGGYTDYQTGNYIMSHQVWLGVPSACDPSNSRWEVWPTSKAVQEWRKINPKFPTTPTHTGGYGCHDWAPYEVNDTLAYAFAANQGNCGKCYLLQFDGEWKNEKARQTHKALKGKSLILMVNNFGVGNPDPDYLAENHFDIQIPGGGPGDFDAFSSQIGVSKAMLGPERGGLLTECQWGAQDGPRIAKTPNNSYSEIGVTLENDWRASLGDFQECLRAKCHRAFDGRDPNLLRGCLWHVEWFMAADNPQANYKEVECPKYLVDRYKSTINTELPKWPEGCHSCNIDGVECPR